MSAGQTTIPRDVLARLVTLLPLLDFTWPEPMQQRWWEQWEWLAREALAHGR